MGKQTSFSSVLKNPGFLNLWVNQILVQFAYNFLNFALIIWVFYLTGSSLAVATLISAIYLPALIFGIFSGMFVDMVDRKKIILFVDLMLAILFIFLIFAKLIFPAILLLTFLINTLTQFFVPAESSALPLLVKKNQLFTANSLFSTTLFAAFLIGFGLSGPTVALFGINAVFIIGSISLFIAFLLASKFPSIKTPLDIATRQLKIGLFKWDFKKIAEVGTQEVKLTFSTIRGKLPVLTALFLLACVQAVVGVLSVLLPPFLERVLQISATDASYIVVMPLGIGMVIGALILGRFGYLFPRRVVVGRAVIVGGLLLLLVGVAPLLSPAIQYFPKPRPLPFPYQPPLSAVMAIGSLLLGMAVVSIIIPSQTVLQENTSEKIRGKVFGVLAAVMSGFSLIPVLTVGVLAEIFGPVPIFIAIGGLVGILGILILRPEFFFEEKHLPLRVREFLGLGHWSK